MNKFNVLEFNLLFYSQRNEHLANVKYTLIFTKKMGLKKPIRTQRIKTEKLRLYI